MVPRLLLASLLPLILTGCASSVAVGAYKLDKELWERAQTEVRERASFELKCPKEQLHLTVLAVQLPSDTSLNAAKQVGVDGCGHRLVYVVSRSGWVLNSSDAETK